MWSAMRPNEPIGAAMPSKSGASSWRPGQRIANPEFNRSSFRCSVQPEKFGGPLYNYPVWREPPVRDWLFHPERFFAVRGQKAALCRLCQKLQIEPVFTAGPEWLGMWATIGALLAYEHGNLKSRGRKKSSTPGNQTDVQVVEAIEYVAQKRNLSFDELLPDGIRWAQETGKLTSYADRTTDAKRLKRVKRRLDEKRRPVKGLLDFSASKPK